MRKTHKIPFRTYRVSLAGFPLGSLDGVDDTMMGSMRLHCSFVSSILILLYICNLVPGFFAIGSNYIYFPEVVVMKKIYSVFIILIALFLVNCPNSDNSDGSNNNTEDEIKGAGTISENQTFIVPSDAPNGEYVGQVRLFPQFEIMGDAAVFTLADNRNGIYAVDNKGLITSADYNLYSREQSEMFGNGYHTLMSTGQETHSLVADPMFTDADGYEFTLTMSSPAIDRGTDLSLSRDYFSNPVETLPDIGVHEVQ